MNDKPQALHVIFGTGPVGLAIMSALQTHDVRIRMVNRSGKADVPTNVEVVKGDATNPADATRIAQGASVIYHALNVDYHLWYDMFPKFNTALIAAAEATGARLVVMENLYMYKVIPGEPITEDSPWEPHTRKGQLRARLAHELLDAHAAGRIQVTIGRASDFFGPGVETSMFGGKRTIIPALKGKGAQFVGNPDLPHTYSYVPDVGRGLVILATDDRALGKIWHIPSPQTVTSRQFFEKVFAEAGHPPKVNIAPRFAIRIMGLFNPVMRELVEMLYEFDDPFVMDHSRFVETFGDIATPLDQAIAETVAWYRQHVTTV